MKDLGSHWMAKGGREEGTECCQVDPDRGMGEAQEPKVEKVVNDGEYGDSQRRSGGHVVERPCSEVPPFHLVAGPGGWSPTV